MTPECTPDNPTFNKFINGLTHDNPAPSQGFCCKCGVDQAWSDTTGGTSTQQRRFAVNCNVLTNSLFLTGIPASASCLRMSADWYPAYLIGAASLDFQLQVGGSWQTAIFEN